MINQVSAGTMPLLLHLHDSAAARCWGRTLTCDDGEEANRYKQQVYRFSRCPACGSRLVGRRHKDRDLRLERRCNAGIFGFERRQQLRRTGNRSGARILLQCAA